MSNATVKSHSTLITRNLVPFKGKIPEQIKILKCPNTLKSFFFFWLPRKATHMETA